jgi:hypothetical protein
MDMEEIKYAIAVKKRVVFPVRVIFYSLFLNSGAAIGFPNNLASFNQFEKGTIGFQIKQI